MQVEAGLSGGEAAPMLLVASLQYSHQGPINVLAIRSHTIRRSHASLYGYYYTDYQQTSRRKSVVGQLYAVSVLGIPRQSASNNM